MARPSSYSEQLADKICDRLADGESLRSICASDGMPHKKTVLRWLRNDEGFRAQYARAREEQAETFVDDITDIADFEDDSAKARVRIDARKWAAGKLKPKKYGDKTQMELTGEAGGPVMVETVVKVVHVKDSE